MKFYFSEMEDPKVQVGREMKRLVLEKIDREEIGNWAHSVYMDCAGMKEPDLKKLLLSDLGIMSLGEEFYFTYEELEKIADDLISGKLPKL
jgi:hypothetical protein